MVINHLLRWVKHAVNFITFFQADLMKMSQQMQEHRQMRIETGTCFWSAVARAALRDEPSRRDETRCAWKKLVAGHWYGCGNCTPSFSPSYIPVDFFCPECLAYFPAIRNSRSTFWDSICLMYISQPWDLLKLASTKKFRDGLENCLAPLQKINGLFTYQKNSQLNQLKRENHLNLKHPPSYLVSRIPAFNFPQIFSRDGSHLPPPP